jgi:hypothetical protein
MKFEYDLFISYSRKDNNPLADGAKGWVSNFQKYLDIRLTQLLGQRPKFLHYGNEEKPNGVELLKCGILISILSPSYVLDEDCIEDLRLFTSEAEQKGMVRVRDKSRIFKVEKYPIPLERQPSAIRNLLGIDMFNQDRETGEVKELNKFFGPEAEVAFWMKLDDLAHDIYDLLREMNVSREPVSIKQAESIYLAETGHDLTIERDLIKRELQRHGYRVLPNHELPSNVREMEAAIKKDLNECKLSIHFIGDAYGDIPQGTDRSIVDIQNQLAAEHCSYVSAVPGAGQSDGEFSRLIWISPTAKLLNEKQKLFIENIKRDAESMSGAEVIQSPLEDLKNIIHKELKNESVGKPSGQNSKKVAGKKSVYLIYDQIDSKECEHIASFLEGNNLDVILPLFKGEIMQVRNQHFDHLRNCDAVLIYYGKASEQWVQMKVLDVLKAPGLGRSNPMVGKAVLHEKGPKLNAEKFKNYNITIIENQGGVSFSLETFVAKLTK